MGATDAMLARVQSEIEERNTFIDSLVEGAQREGRDLDSKEMEMVGMARSRLEECAKQADLLKETVRIARDSHNRTVEITEQMQTARNPTLLRVDYRSAGEYLLDVYRAGIGSTEAAQKLDLYNRAAQHQTTADNPGLLPEQILGPVLNFVDQSRPIVNALGPRQLPSGSWSRPRVTQHTQVAPQTAEKTELVSRKMTITKLPVSADTYGGYVNVSRQNTDWSVPQVMDLVINDLAGQYAMETEQAAGAELIAQSTAGPTLPADATGADVSAALWTAAGSAYSAMGGSGGLLLAVSPDMLGLVGPLFAPVNPTNAYSTGFNAGSFGSGAMGAVSGITVVMSAQLPAQTMLVINTSAAEVYEDRIGSLQVVEPSVLGIQVAYAGYFTTLVIEPEGIVKLQAPPVIP